jgi:alkylation response protein AidB-like acyl-CoA dehydrogenase
MWITNGTQADRACTLCVTGDAVDSRHANKSMILVPLDTKGIDRRQKLNKLGQRSSDTAMIFFDDVRVPARYLIGEEGAGWDVAMLLLSFERGASALPQYAAFRREVDDIVGLARTMGRDGDPNLRQKVAKSIVELECLRYHSLHLLTQVEQGKELGAASSMTKLQWSETHQDIGELFADVAGVTHQTPDVADDLDDLLASFLWSRSETIWGGSSQVQRNIVADLVLGLPR